MSDAGETRADERRARGRRSLALDVLIAVAAFVVAELFGGPGPRSVGGVALTAVASGLLVWRRSAPVLVLGGTLAVEIVIAALGVGEHGIAPAIALYTTAVGCERRVSIAALVPITTGSDDRIAARTVDETPASRQRRPRSGRWKRAPAHRHCGSVDRPELCCRCCSRAAVRFATDRRLLLWASSSQGVCWRSAPRTPSKSSLVSTAGSLRCTRRGDVKFGPGAAHVTGVAVIGVPAVISDNAPPP